MLYASYAQSEAHVPSSNTYCRTVMPSCRYAVMPLCLNAHGTAHPHRCACGGQICPLHPIRRQVGTLLSVGRCIQSRCGPVSRSVDQSLPSYSWHIPMLRGAWREASGNTEKERPHSILLPCPVLYLLSISTRSPVPSPLQPQRPTISYIHHRVLIPVQPPSK